MFSFLKSLATRWAPEEPWLAEGRQLLLNFSPRQSFAPQGAVVQLFSVETKWLNSNRTLFSAADRQAIALFLRLKNALHSGNLCLKTEHLCSYEATALLLLEGFMYSYGYVLSTNAYMLFEDKAGALAAWYTAALSRRECADLGLTPNQQELWRAQDMLHKKTTKLLFPHLPHGQRPDLSGLANEPLCLKQLNDAAAHHSEPLRRRP